MIDVMSDSSYVMRGTKWVFLRNKYCLNLLDIQGGSLYHVSNAVNHETSKLGDDI